MVLANDSVLPEGCDSLISQLSALRYSHNSSGRFVAESKDDLKKRGISSPDEADAFNLTFAAFGVEYEAESDKRNNPDFYFTRYSAESWMG